MFLMFILDSLSYHCDAFKHDQERFSDSEQRTTTVFIYIIYFHVQAGLGDATDFSDRQQKYLNKMMKNILCLLLFAVVIKQHSSSIILFESFTSQLFGDTELTFPDIHFSHI